MKISGLPTLNEKNICIAASPQTCESANLNVSTNVAAVDNAIDEVEQMHLTWIYRDDIPSEIRDNVEFDSINSTRQCNSTKE